MKAYVNVKNRVTGKANTPSYFRVLLIEPLSNGLYGFALFFSILLLTKALSSFLGVQKGFEVDLGDVLLSFIGFLLLFLVKVLENIGRIKN